MALLTGQGKLNEALHENVCDGKWSLRVTDPCANINLSDIKNKLSGSLLSGITWDWFVKQSFNSTTDDFIYYLGGLSGVVVATIRITYEDSTKCKVLSGGRV